MPKVDFFAPEYKKETPVSDVCFGIIDDGHLSRTVTEKELIQEEWDVVVCNRNSKECLFIPVDHNIVVKNKDNEMSQCDGMLTASDRSNLVFIEIKDQRKGADSEAIEQLYSTIFLFLENNDYAQWEQRRAYIVNKQHPRFHHSNKTIYQDFFNRTHFRLCKEKIIEIK